MEYSTEKEFINLVADKRSFIVFSSTPWCPNCKFVDAMFVAESISTEKVIKVDPEATGLAMMLGVEAVPSISKFVEGELVDVVEGIIGPEELRECVYSLSIDESAETEKRKVGKDSKSKSKQQKDEVVDETK